MGDNRVVHRGRMLVTALSPRVRTRSALAWLAACLAVAACSGAAAPTGTAATPAAKRPTVFGSNEPVGMNTQVKTGPIASMDSIDIVSPSGAPSGVDWSGNLSLVPNGTGLRLTYRPDLVAGNSPVRFQFAIQSPGTGWYYQRMRVRFSSNWTTANNPVVKLCEPRTYQHGSGSGSTENHVIGAWAQPFGPTQLVPAFLQQGPNSIFGNYYPSATPDVITDGNWHQLEVLFTPESSPGAGNGSIDFWVDGASHYQKTNVKFLAAGNAPGWPSLMFDPVYGGVKSSPPATMYWDVDQLYVSTL